MLKNSTPPSTPISDKFQVSTSPDRPSKGQPIPEILRLDANSHHPVVSEKDKIYQCDGGAIVVSEYKLLFFEIPFNGISELDNVTFMQRGNDGEKQNVRRLCDYDTAKATELMVQPNWTRAVFLRDPKERLLKSFMTLSKNDYYRKECCERRKRFFRNEKRNRETKLQCNENILLFASFLEFTAPGNACEVNDHWAPQTRMIDENWWPYINFIGYVGNATVDAKRLLSSVRSTADGRTAWEKHGMNELNIIREMYDKHTVTRSDLEKHYTPELEEFVESKWKEDWTHPYTHFPAFKIFQESDRIQ